MEDTPPTETPEQDPDMKKSLLTLLLCGSMTTTQTYAADGMMVMDHSAMRHHQTMMDDRTPLDLSPEMKQHQLSNMRSHLAAIRSIIGLMERGDYDLAADVAHTKLGLTEEMRKMCTTMSDNVRFTELGLAFHKSGDDLGDALKTKDPSRSLRALRTTMDYCVECHASFRQ